MMLQVLTFHIICLTIGIVIGTIGALILYKLNLI